MFVLLFDICVIVTSVFLTVSDLKCPNKKETKGHGEVLIKIIMLTEIKHFLKYHFSSAEPVLLFLLVACGLVWEHTGRRKRKRRQVDECKLKRGRN